MGDVGCNFSWMFVGNFLMIFYTDVFGISMGAVAGLMLFSRFWDAVNDPIIGSLTDRTHTRWGDVYKRQGQERYSGQEAYAGQETTGVMDWVRHCTSYSGCLAFPGCAGRSP